MLLIQVARLLQPSVILIEDTEKIFYKKVPKEEREVILNKIKVEGFCLAIKYSLSFCWMLTARSKTLKERPAQVSQAGQRGRSCSDSGDI